MLNLATDAAGETVLRGGRVVTRDEQVYRDELRLGAGTTLEGGLVEARGNVMGGGNDLRVEGNAVLGDASEDRLGGVRNLSVRGTTRLNAGEVTTTGEQGYEGAVTLGGNVQVASTGGGGLGSGGRWMGRMGWRCGPGGRQCLTTA